MTLELIFKNGDVGLKVNTDILHRMLLNFDTVELTDKNEDGPITKEVKKVVDQTRGTNIAYYFVPLIESVTSSKCPRGCFCKATVQPSHDMIVFICSLIVCMCNEVYEKTKSNDLQTYIDAYKNVNGFGSLHQNIVWLSDTSYCIDLSEVLAHCSFEDPIMSLVSWILSRREQSEQKKVETKRFEALSERVNVVEKLDAVVSARVNTIVQSLSLMKSRVDKLYQLDNIDKIDKLIETDKVVKPFIASLFFCIFIFLFVKLCL